MRLNIAQDFFLKNRFAVMHIARDFLVTDLDNRIQTVDYYVETLGVSRGTIQNAMQFLVEQKCVTTYFRGHLGSFLIAKDNAKLWEYSGFGILSGAMAIPLDTIASGLATGVCDCMKAEDIAFNCVFVQGSKIRIRGLRQGKYDFIVASNLTEQLILKEHEDIEKVLSLPNCHYSGRYLLMFSNSEKTQIEDGMTLAVDPTSIDQVYLSELVSEGKDTKILESTYLNTISMVVNGEADVTISRSDAAAHFDMDYREAHFKEISLPGNYTSTDIVRFSGAVVLVSKSAYGLVEILRKVLRPTVIAHAQRQVMNNLRTPSYY